MVSLTGYYRASSDMNTTGGKLALRIPFGDTAPSKDSGIRVVSK